MTDRTAEQRRLENLELRKETLADLSPTEAEQARGGLLQKGPELQAYTKAAGTCTCPDAG